MFKKMILLAGVLGLTACATETPMQQQAHYDRVLNELYVSEADNDYFQNSPQKKQADAKMDYYEHTCPRYQTEDEQTACWQSARSFMATYQGYPKHYIHPDPLAVPPGHDDDVTDRNRMYEFYHRMDNLGVGY